MEAFVLFVHIVVCLMLIIVVLLQSGKSADLAGAFGGYGSQSSFGPRGGATFLSRLTTILAVLFMVLTLLLMIVASKKSHTQSVMGSEPAKQEQKVDETAQPAAVTEQEGVSTTEDKTAGSEETKTEETKTEDTSTKEQ